MNLSQNIKIRKLLQIAKAKILLVFMYLKFIFYCLQQQQMGKSVL